ncbi:hypothetical protein J3R30DRAFT_3624184 [Lentinula aciculospora]|uniref:DUF7704 domain-containing protein n=1 Tax=Lentinula aciculospora TaxID=153920 RepID=A0A9W8ZRT4_9AGAR|nr:hypothetical protein J3R30DRAFT_3624184 [Lentinula aciculospora]
MRRNSPSSSSVTFHLSPHTSSLLLFVLPLKPSLQMMSNLQALPGFYKLLFLYLEPVSAIIPAPMIWLWPGATWFRDEQIPHSDFPFLSSTESLDPRTAIASWHLGNCYMLVGLILSFVFRVVGNAFWDNPVAQEQVVGAILTAMAIADVTHVLSSFIGLPPDLRYNILSWNGITHGNITFTTFIFCVRLAWFLGVGRRRFYYGRNDSVRLENKSR